MNRRDTLAIAPLLTALALTSSAQAATGNTTDVKIDPFNQIGRASCRERV